MISVIIPVLNEERTIGKCLYSLTHQIIPPDEIIIIDNESDDSTVEIASQYTDKIYIVKRSANIEQLRKIAVDIAQGDIIFSTDGDCVPPIDWIESSLKHFEDRVIVGVAGRCIDIRQQPIEGLTVALLERIFVGFGANSAFRKDAYEISEGYQSFNGKGNFSDVILFKNLKKVGKVKFDETILMPTYIEGTKWGFLPMMIKSGLTIITGLSIRKKHKTWSDILVFGGLGMATGEVAHQLGHNIEDPEIAEKYKKALKVDISKISIHHDLFGLLGDGATMLLHLSGTIKKQTAVKMYSFFTAMILQHFITEGTSFFPNMHTERWAMVGE